MQTKLLNEGCGDGAVEEQKPLDATTEIPQSSDVPVVDDVDAEQAYDSEDMLMDIEGRATPGGGKLPFASRYGVSREVRNFEIWRTAL